LLDLPQAPEIRIKAIVLVVLDLVTLCTTPGQQVLSIAIHHANVKLRLPTKRIAPRAASGLGKKILQVLCILDILFLSS
jgi:hypothetical protein